MSHDGNIGPDSWDYDVLAVAESGGFGLKQIAFDIFNSEGLIDDFGIPHERFKALLARVELLYSVENPYHCALHAADVLAATHCLRKGLPDVFDKLEILALYLAALGHDAGHFRLNNAFLKNSKHTLFKKYPESVLENFHLGLMFELLDDDNVGITKFLKPDDLGRFKSLVTYLILATDMSKHMGLFNEFKQWMDNAVEAFGPCSTDSIRMEGFDDFETSSGAGDGGGGGGHRSDSGKNKGGHAHWVKPAIDNASETDRRLVMQFVLKCADLGNVVRSLEVADAWGKRIMEEFYQQGEKELALGLPLTTFPNRKNFDYIFARHQNGFLINVVRPLFEVFTELTDPDTREAVISSAAENQEAWTRRENENKPKSSEERKKHSAGKDVATTTTVGGVTVKKTLGLGKLSRQTTMGWMKEFKQSNLTMLTSNAMEMKGLEVPLDDEYGANDEASSVVRNIVPFIPRLELTRLAKRGLLGPMTADAPETTAADMMSSAAKSLSHNAAVQESRLNEEFDAAVVVVTFQGFLQLCERVLETEKEEKKQSSGKTAGDNGNNKDNSPSQSAAIIAAAVSGCLSKAVSNVHAAGGDVIRMGYDGLVCVFPMSGKKNEEFGASKQTGAVLRAVKCAFTLVSQLSSSTPELSSLLKSEGVDADADGGATASRAHLWPGLRKYSMGMRVLVVESLQLSRMTLGRLLDHFGCMTHFAENASQAAAACANMEFDVVLIDLVLPDLDGYEVARHVREHGGPVNSQAYICALTALQQPELLEQCLRAGMDDTIEKPADMESLQATFRKAREIQRMAKKGGGGRRPGRHDSHHGGEHRGEAAARREMAKASMRRTSTRLFKSASSIVGGSRSKGAGWGDHGGQTEKCTPVSMPRYADMLVSSSAIRAELGSSGGEYAKGAAAGGGGGGGRGGGPLARLCAALCGGGGGGGGAVSNKKLSNPTAEVTATGGGGCRW